MGKLLLFHFRVTNSKLKYKKILPGVINSKKEKQNLDFKVALDFSIEMEYYKIQSSLKKI